MIFPEGITARLRALLGVEDHAETAEHALRRAIATLLVRALTVDGTETIEETMKLVDLLEARFGLSDQETAELVTEAKTAERDAVDLFAFTNTVTQHLDRDGRIGVLEMMFEVVAADGVVDVFEENLISRAATLLRVPDYYQQTMRPRLFASMAGR